MVLTDDDDAYKPSQNDEFIDSDRSGAYDLREVRPAAIPARRKISL